MEIQKGKKKCPKCQGILACRKSSCECGHVFYETKTKKESAPKVSGPGPGRKLCGNCNTYVGVRNAVCPSCQYTFPVKAKPENPVAHLSPAKAQKQEEEKKVLFNITGGTGNTNLKICLVPAGECPIKVQDWTKEGLLEWARKVQLEEEKKGYALANEGLAYWARTFYTFFRDADKENLVKETFPVDKEGI